MQWIVGSVGEREREREREEITFVCLFVCVTIKNVCKMYVCDG